MDRNARVIEKRALQGRVRTVPDTDIPATLEPGRPYDTASLPKITLSRGVTAVAYWNKGALVEQVEMEGGATYPDQTLGEELITVITEGSATCILEDKTLELTKETVLYLTEGTKRSLIAGPNGCKAIEVYSPARVDHLRMAGATIPPDAKVSFADEGVRSSLEPRVVYDLNEIQLSPLTDPDPEQTYKRAGASARLIWGRNAQLSILRMDPDSRFPLHIHPEHQIMTLLRGAMHQTIIDRDYLMTGANRPVLLMPGGMVHAGSMSEFGADALDVFWPVRPDYIERAQKQQALFEQVIAPGVKPVKVADGFTFTQGPTWLNGRLYFSDLYIPDATAGDGAGDPDRSRIIAMDPGGKWRVLAQGMQANGISVSRNGNLLVCDTLGHRVIEVDPSTGRIIRTVLDRVNGAPIAGPNDIAMDLKGDIYVTDPPSVSAARKNQSGSQVYYLAEGGTPRVVVPAGEFAVPNGVEISPDGKTLYLVNAWGEPGGNYIWAFDIREDGSLANKRRWAVLNLPAEVLSAKEPANRYDSGADGTAMDTDGRLYVSTRLGVQIFDSTGTYVGTIHGRPYPLSCTFGGKNYDVLYMVNGNEVWSIQTKVKGFRNSAPAD